MQNAEKTKQDLRSTARIYRETVNQSSWQLQNVQSRKRQQKEKSCSVSCTAVGDGTHKAKCAVILSDTIFNSLAHAQILKNKRNKRKERKKEKPTKQDGPYAHTNHGKRESWFIPHIWWI